jgi:RHS repeat-associated protein
MSTGTMHKHLCMTESHVCASRFTGKERDAESGLDNFSARYFGSSMGRFMSPDPIIMNPLRMINPQRWNKYSYAVNSPLVFDDPSGKDAIYVNFNKMANGEGHAGIISVHADGSATYSRFGPETPGRPVGAGQIQTDSSLPTVQFGANGLPTDASYSALISAVAGFESNIEGSTIDPSTVGMDYFKTSSAETAALDQYINAMQAASNAGKAPTYCVIGSSCRDYALSGLIVGGAVDRWRAPYLSIVPNTLFLQLQGLDDGNKDPESGHKKNTSPPCLKRRDTGGCA